MDTKGREESKAKGGLARAAKLSPEERSAIATRAAKKRWSLRVPDSQMPKVLAEFKDEIDLGGIKIPCAVIEGPNGVQRILTETGITNAVLGVRSGASKRLKSAASEAGDYLPLFVAPSQLHSYIDEAIQEGPLHPIDYVDGERIVRGYDASVLPVVCDIWLRARADGKLQVQQLDKAQKAEIMTRALAHVGIIALIDEATGYEKVRPQNALQAFLDKVLRKELAAWAKRFPDEFYENIYKLKGWKWPGMSKNRYSVCAHYTRDLIYERLGPGVLKELEERSPKNEKGYRPNKLHQWFTDDIGHPLLSQHMHAMLVLQRLAIANGYSWTKFLTIVNQATPKRDSNLVLPLEETS